MPALNFQPQWADAVELGAHHANGVLLYMPGVLPKRTTIRRPGRAQPGQPLYLYTGQRTKACRKLGEVLCLSVTSILVARAGSVRLEGRLLEEAQAERLARLDTAGLWGLAEIVQFLDAHYGLPFVGELIGW